VSEAKRGAAFCAASTRAAGQGLTGGAERSAIVAGSKEQKGPIDRGAAKRSDVPLVLLFPAQMRYSSIEPGPAYKHAFLGLSFLIDKVYRLCILAMSDYSISEAARQLGIQRRTLYKWIREKYVPAPSTRVVAGTRLRFWNEEGMAKLRQYKAARFWGKGKSKKSKKSSKV
jgi:excisionase family DNA binding protein